MCGVASGWIGDHVGAGLGERLDVPLGPLDHQVHVEHRRRGPCTRSRIASTISGPIVIGGTKCPSITSTWITAHRRPSPARSARRAARSRPTGSTARSAGSGISRRVPLLRMPACPAGPFAKSRNCSTAGRGGTVAECSAYHCRCGSPPRTGISASAPARELVLDRDARLERDAEAEPHRLLDRAVRAERQRLRPQLVLGEELGDELARARARLAHQPDAVAELARA